MQRPISSGIPFGTRFNTGERGHASPSGPKRTARTPPYAQIELVANDVAQDARVRRTLQDREWVSLGVAQQEVNLGLRIPTLEEVERVRLVVNTS